MIMLFLLACNGSEIKKLKEENAKLRSKNQLLESTNNRFETENKTLKDQVEKQFFTTPEGIKAKIKYEAIKEANNKRIIEKSWCDMNYLNNHYSSIEVLPFELRSPRELLVKRCDGSNCAICSLTIKESILTSFIEISSIEITEKGRYTGKRKVKFTRKDKTVAEYEFYNMKYFSASY